MKIVVKVIPSSKQNALTRLSDGTWRIHLQAPPDKGKANVALIRFLSQALSLPQSSIQILRGHTSRIKTLELPPFQHFPIL